MMSRWSKIAQVVKREIVEILPVTIFFLISFQLITFTKHLVLAREGIVWEGFITATIGALVIAKVVLIVDHLPFMRFYRGRPLYRPILYRTAVYTLCVLAFRLLELLVRNAIQTGGLASGLEAARAEVVWQEFSFIQIWIFVLFLIYINLDGVARGVWHRHGERSPVLGSQGVRRITRPGQTGEE